MANKTKPAPKKKEVVEEATPDIAIELGTEDEPNESSPDIEIVLDTKDDNETIEKEKTEEVAEARVPLSEDRKVVKRVGRSDTTNYTLTGRNSPVKVKLIPAPSGADGIDL